MADEAVDVTDTDEWYGSVGGMPLDERLWSLRYQPAITGFPDPTRPRFGV